MEDKTLSTYAHNVKIVTVNGQVIVKGPVKSEEEKQQVGTDVTSVISADNFTNELTVSNRNNLSLFHHITGVTYVQQTRRSLWHLQNR
jgi:hypothetical protein